MQTFSMIVTGMATAVIAVYAVLTYRLSKQISRQSELHQQDLDDLFEAIVVATLLSGPTTIDFDRTQKAFENHYKGKRKVFK